VKLYLLTALFEAKTEQRAIEFKECVLRNVDNENFTELIIFFKDKEQLPNFWERYDYLKHDKIKVLHTNGRKTFKMLFDYANQHLAGQPVIIANGDIYFDQNSNIERAREISKDELWTITRYNYHSESGEWRLEGDGNDLFGSHDVWVFQAPMKEFERHLFIGAYGCDSYLSQKAIEAGVTVLNPCKSIITRHNHQSVERYEEYQPGKSYQHKEDYMIGGYDMYLAPPSYLEEKRAIKPNLLWQLRYRYRRFRHLLAPVKKLFAAMIARYAHY
jgi:hypothetical protein